MAEDYYSDNPGPEGASKEEPKEEGGETERSYVLPKEVLMGKDFKPGDELVLKITAIHDDQIEVSYAPAKDQEEKSESPEHEAAEGAEGGAPAKPGEMSSMMDY